MATVAEMASPEAEGLPVPDWPVRFVCAILLLTPPVFALITWERHYEFMALRQFSLPIIVAEALIVIMAMRSGFSFGPALKALSLTAQIAGGVLAAVAIGTTILASIDPLNAQILFFTTAIHAVFMLAIWDRFNANWRGARLVIVQSLIAGIAIYMGLVLILIWTVRGAEDFDWIAFGIGVSNVRQLGYYGLALTGHAAGFMVTAQTQRQRVIAALIVFLGFYFTQWAGGRSSVFGCLALIGVVTVYAPSGQKSRFLGWALALFALALPLAMVTAPSDEIGAMTMVLKLLGIERETGVDASSSGRVAIWVETWRAFLDRPIFGYGEGQFRHGVTAGQGLLNHPHNSLLQFLFQWGAVGTLALAMLVMGPLLKLYQAAERDPQIALAGIGALSGLAAMSLLDGAFYYPLPIMVSLLSLALIASAAHSSKEPASLG